MIGDGNRKRAPFLVLGTVFPFLEQIVPSPAAHTCLMLRGFLRMSRRGYVVQKSRLKLSCFWPTIQRVYVSWNFRRKLLQFE